ncbi:MAG: nickel-dependent hydrogenase large subunit [Anaerolineaceae bacterium]|jgi:NADH-quinone oxidoreductase subunit D
MEAKVSPQKFIVPIGPQHPALKEPGHFEFTVEGEVITGATVRLGYVHRGIEKSTEDRNWTQNLYLLERICGICSHIHATAYTLGVEALADVTAPPRAQAIRTLVCELERIHSHMLWLGVAAHEGGFETLFMYSWRDRETVMDLLEGLSGNRVNYSVNVLGGVKIDVDEKQATAIRKGIDFLKERTEYYMKVVTTDETFLGRTRDVGTMTYDQADALAAVGPTARASGIARDIRADAPYAAYPQFPIKVITEKGGDLSARFIVRINELYEAYRLIHEILDKMPTGELTTRVPRRIPENETISRVEAPRGELFYYLKSNGSEKPERIKVRTPSICNWATVMNFAIGLKLADMPMILAGIDPCFSCSDRMVIINQSNQSQVWSWEDLRQYGIKHYR